VAGCSTRVKTETARTIGTKNGKKIVVVTYKKVHLQRTVAIRKDERDQQQIGRKDHLKTELVKVHTRSLLVRGEAPPPRRRCFHVPDRQRVREILNLGDGA
jgi:hypothetical protein